MLRYSWVMPVATALKVEALSKDFHSQRKLAAALGVSPAQVSRWRRGQGIDSDNADRLDLLELVMSSLLRLLSADARHLQTAKEVANGHPARLVGRYLSFGIVSVQRVNDRTQK